MTFERALGALTGTYPVGYATDPGTLATAREAIAALGIEVHLPSEAIAIESARLRRRYPISLPDAYCLATVKHPKATLASYDQRILKAAKSEALPTV